TPQVDALATFAPPLTREHGRLDLGKSAREVVNLVRGLSPRPGAYSSASAKTLKVLTARVAVEDGEHGAPGTVIRAGKSALWVAAGRGVVELVRAQVEGRKPMSAVDLVNGRALKLGDVLG